MKILVDGPSNFSFIDDFLAGSAVPQNKSNLKFYIKKNIKNIVTLTSNKPLALHYIDTGSFNLLHLPISSPPINNEMIKRFIDFLKNANENHEKVVVHCQFGQERTGIMLVIYLMEIKGFNVRDAISEIRNKRPGSLQMRSTLEFLLSKYS